MRYIMKGGVWKNSQDQILKAAIMKYGLNQWSRISSLLPRKSAKQCKQRWYEWLDPSIKKTQWTRSEDQKLLQLARVFPSQWRTIAPFVGRTPTQCYERYQKLLDMAQGKTGRQSQDLKKLRPGQIDPNPQTKPARLDPIDMDQDQKQMLAEVRVRLANTKGKKAKRKQRQKIIQQARRLAQLQKIRQLEMAGVDNIPTAKQIKRMKQRRDIDYNKQIPFKRDVPQFKYKLQQSQTPKNLSFAQTITLQTLEGKRRDVQQQLQRKLDKRRMKKFKQRDLKTALMLKNDFQKPKAFPIQMPQPQIGQRDLQNMKKFNITTPLNTLLANYQNQSQNPYGMTPQNKIMFSARVNYSLNHQDLRNNQEMQQKQQKQERDIGLEGLNYLKKIERQKQGQRNQMKMRSIDRIIAKQSQRMKTPSLNQWQQNNTIKLKSLFGKMSKPQNMIQFQIPEQEQQEQQQIIIDAELLEKQQQKKQQIQLQEIIKYKSQVLKRNLPRPNRIPSFKQFLSITHKELSIFDMKAQQLVQRQMLVLINSDALDYPLKQTHFPQQQEEIPYKQHIPFEQLSKAREMIDQQVIQQKQHKRNLVITLDSYKKAKKYIKLNYQTKQVQLLQKEIAQIQKKQEQTQNYMHINYEAKKQKIKKTDHHQKKTKKLMAGYQRLIKNKISQLNNMQDQLQKLTNQRIATERMKQQERMSIKSRLQELEFFYKKVYGSI